MADKGFLPKDKADWLIYKRPVFNEKTKTWDVEITDGNKKYIETKSFNNEEDASMAAINYVMKKGKV